jgi:hypothetical protein
MGAWRSAPTPFPKRPKSPRPSVACPPLDLGRCNHHEDGVPTGIRALRFRGGLNYLGASGGRLAVRGRLRPLSGTLPVRRLKVAIRSACAFTSSRCLSASFPSAFLSCSFVARSASFSKRNRSTSSNGNRFGGWAPIHHQGYISRVQAVHPGGVGLVKRGSSGDGIRTPVTAVKEHTLPGCYLMDSGMAARLENAT